MSQWPATPHDALTAPRPAFDYTKVIEPIKGQNPDGSLNAGQTFQLQRSRGITPVDHDALGGAEPIPTNGPA